MQIKRYSIVFTHRALKRAFLRAALVKALGISRKLAVQSEIIRPKLAPDIQIQRPEVIYSFFRLYSFVKSFARSVNVILDFEFIKQPGVFSLGPRTEF